MTKKKTAISPTREEDFSEWYQQVIKAADLAENSSVRGCMVIKPHGYALWEKMQGVLDREFKRTGHKNAYFPVLIPLKLFEKEAEHIEGFAKECAVVTHRRLVQKDGKLLPDGQLTEPYIIRPTSELVIGESFAKWVQSYRDLPLKINQWANVMRWEMRPRIFLRTTEFLWQEGHTVHATPEEAMEETMTMLGVYREFAENTMAMPVIPGEKTIHEKFPGADRTFTIESMMQDGKALQAGTSHFLGQNFAKAQEIKYFGKDEKEHYAWTTSWGMSTRMIGGLIMMHSDDDGLVIPPRMASTHVSVIPIYRTPAERENVYAYINSLRAQLEQIPFGRDSVQMEIDEQDTTGGEKYWANIKRGHPLIIEVGPRDIAEGKVFLTRRVRDEADKPKEGVAKERFVQDLPQLLEDTQRTLFTRAKARMDSNIIPVADKKEFVDLFAGERPRLQFASAYVDDNAETQEFLSQHQVSIRCIPLSEPAVTGKTCIFSGKPVAKRALLARSY